jgi:hypothetical protein
MLTTLTASILILADTFPWRFDRVELRCDAQKSIAEQPPPRYDQVGTNGQRTTVIGSEPGPSGGKLIFRPHDHSFGLEAQPPLSQSPFVGLHLGLFSRKQKTGEICHARRANNLVLRKQILIFRTSCQLNAPRLSLFSLVTLPI